MDIDLERRRAQEACWYNSAATFSGVCSVRCSEGGGIQYSTLIKRAPKVDGLSGLAPSITQRYHEGFAMDLRSSELFSTTQDNPNPGPRRPLLSSLPGFLGRVCQDLSCSGARGEH